MKFIRKKAIIGVKKTHLYSLELFGKHCSNDGSGRKSGEAGSAVCFLCPVFLEFAVGGSKVKAALIPELMEEHISFLHATTSNPGKKEVLGSFAGVEWIPFLHTIEVVVACTEAISIQAKK